jgi:hypothetical protein
VSCEKPAPIAAPEPERKRPSPTKIQDVPESPAGPTGEQPTAQNLTRAEKPTSPTPAAPRPPSTPSLPEATSVEGQPGFVYSPFNGRIIDVRGLPSGTLVADPTAPASEKKHFRVP